MAYRQAAGRDPAPPVGTGGREAQRRRTRAAILDATTRLLAEGGEPSIDDIAAAADVSRRTVYMYFPTLDQLLLDATLGALSATKVEEALDRAERADDTRARVDALVRTLTRLSAQTLPLGRRLIQLTVSGGTDTGPRPRRGYRRVAWVERAVDPLRDRLSAEQFDRLVSALAVVIGWEAMVVLRDVRGLRPKREEEVLRWAADVLVTAMLAEAADGASS